MLLENKNAVIYGASGGVGSAVARAFAHEGARVFLTGRRLGAIEALAREITDGGGMAEAAQVDALDEQAVEQHMNEVVQKAGSIDIAFNAIGIPQEGIQGILLTDLSVESFTLPITTYARSHFITSRAAARKMIQKGSGVILMHTPEPAKLSMPHTGGMSPAWAAMEALSRDLSVELGAQGIRTICLRTTGLPETKTIETVFSVHAKAIGVTREEFQAMAKNASHTGRATTLAELAHTAVFAASDRSSAMTGAVINLTGGVIAD